MTLATAACMCAGAVTFPVASANAQNAPAFAPYGEVAVVGGYDPAALTGDPTLTPGDFVDPVGMTVVPDASAPGGALIYVLDNTNPAEVNALDPVPSGPTANPANLSMDYRVQELEIVDGAEKVVGCTTFALNSTASAPGQRAEALAADGNQVDVLVNDMPGQANGNDSGTFHSAAYEIDQWSAALSAPAGGSCEVDDSPSVAVTPAALQANAASYKGDIDGDSLAFAGAELALGGTQYSKGGPASGPIIERFGAAGTVDGAPWTVTPDKTSPAWVIAGQTKITSQDVLYAMSANDDGSLNVTFGPADYFANNIYGRGLSPSQEPIMANVSLTGDTWATQYLLPSADAAEPQGGTAQNMENGATDEVEQDAANGTPLSGASRDGGTLAPSVIQLSEGDGSLYAGLVADDPSNANGYGVVNEDSAGNPLSGAALPAWTMTPSTGSTANLGIRIFDPTEAGSGQSGDTQPGEPLGMIGNATLGGTCGVQGGSFAMAESGLAQTTPIAESTLALAAGPNGTLYALDQPDLDAPGDLTASDPQISPQDPASSIQTITGTTVYGDTLLEFAPGAGTQCPQPTGTGGETITDELPTPVVYQGQGTSPGGAVAPAITTVTGGPSLQFDASAVNLQGGVPWAYEWTVQQCSQGFSNCPTVTPTAAPSPLPVSPSGCNAPADSPFTPDTSDSVDERPVATYDFDCTQPGDYQVTLDLLNDFGTLPVTQDVAVTAPQPFVASLSGPTQAVAGQPVTFDASADPGPGDEIVDYNWNFGTGADDTAAPQDTYSFPAAGTYTVTLTAYDAVGRSSVSTQTIDVSPAPPGPAPVVPTNTTTTGTGTTPTPRVTVNKSPTNVSPRVRAIDKSTKLAVALSCPKTKVSCGGAVQVRTATAMAIPHTKGKHVLTLGKAAFDLKGGASTTIVIRLGKPTRQLIAEVQGVLKLTVTVVAHDSFGDAKTVRLPFDIFPPLSHRPRKFG